MFYRWLADFLLLTHAMFVVFAVFGGALALWRPWVAWVHLPAAAWAVLIEYGDWICPLTPLENAARVRGGITPYYDGFIAHYLLRALYPSDLTRGLQWLLGTVALVMNILIYGLVLRRRHRPRLNRRIG